MWRLFAPECTQLFVGSGNHEWHRKEIEHQTDAAEASSQKINYR